MAVGMNSHPKQTVIFLRLSVLGLLGLENPDDPDIDQTPDVRRCVHEYHDVEWIAITPKGGGDEPESNGNIMPSGNSPPNLKCSESGSYLNLLRKPFGVSIIALH